MRKRNGFSREFLGFLVSLGAFALAVVIFASSALTFTKRSGERGADTLRDAIRRASVQCYAMEGRYPPSLEYLEENYGIAIDRDRYDVFYSGFASNFMPDITVNLQNP